MKEAKQKPVRVDLPVRIHRDLKIQAIKEDRRMREIIISALKAYLGVKVSE